MAEEMIRVLVVGTSDEVASEIVRRLQKAGYEVFSLRVDTSEAMRMALERQGWDVVFSQRTIPRFDWKTAFRMARQTDADVPFILISDEPGEEIAVEAMKAGISDYLIRDRLERVGLVVTNELRDAKINRERRQAAKRVEKLTAFAQASSRINRLLLDVRTESDLYARVVEILSDLPGIRLAWIGLTQKGTRIVKPVAQKGFESGYLSSVRITWDDSEYGRGPTGTAIRTGKPSVMRDIKEDIRYRPWREEALKRGYASSIAVPLVSEGEVVGALNLYSESRDAFDEEEVRFLTEVAHDIAVGIRAVRFEKRLEDSCGRLQAVWDGGLEAWSRVAGFTLPFLADHGRKVAALACRIAQEMGLGADRAEAVRCAAYLHDIGMGAIPKTVLGRPGPLTEEDRVLVRSHPRIGRDIIAHARLPWPVAEVVLQHHERLDGSGYPEGLRAEAISLESRIVAVADVWVAMTSDRPHRQALSVEQAVTELKAKRSVLYDPDVLDAFLRVAMSK